MIPCMRTPALGGKCLSILPSLGSLVVGQHSGVRARWLGCLPKPSGSSAGGLALGAPSHRELLGEKSCRCWSGAPPCLLAATGGSESWSAWSSALPWLSSGCLPNLHDTEMKPEVFLQLKGLGDVVFVSVRCVCCSLSCPP